LVNWPLPVASIGGNAAPGRKAPGGGTAPADAVPAAAQFMESPAPICCADKVQSR
jgi:hypothetical protein